MLIFLSGKKAFDSVESDHFLLYFSRLIETDAKSLNTLGNGAGNGSGSGGSGGGGGANSVHSRRSSDTSQVR